MSLEIHTDWEQEALNWAKWVRRPGHDSFDQFNWKAFQEILPAPGKSTLDMGCGEGRVSRKLKALSHRVKGIDAAPTLIKLAREADPGGDYQLADAAALPFDSNSFDLVIAFNVLMDVSDMRGAVREASRVLKRGGRLCICITHPTNDAGTFSSEDPESQFIIADTYLAKRRFEGRFERDGLIMTFRGWCYPLEEYARALEDSGFLIEMIREPSPGEDVVKQRTSLARFRRVPMFLHLRALKA